MDAEQTQYWVAYFAIQDPKYRESIENNIHLEKQTKLSDAQRAEQIKALFMGKR